MFRLLHTVMHLPNLMLIEHVLQFVSICLWRLYVYLLYHKLIDRKHAKLVTSIDDR